eukprot:9929063-Alexandrium_andersonii.AAC.1
MAFSLIAKIVRSGQTPFAREVAVFALAQTAPFLTNGHLLESEPAHCESCRQALAVGSANRLRH